MDNIEIDVKEYSKQRVEEIMNEPHGLVVTIAVPEIKEEHLFGDEDVHIQPCTSVKSGEKGCNPFTIAMAIELLRGAITKFEEDPSVAIAEAILGATLEDNGTININTKTGEVKKVGKDS